jgi:hypothetical protein
MLGVPLAQTPALGCHRTLCPCLRIWVMRRANPRDVPRRHRRSGAIWRADRGFRGVSAAWPIAAGEAGYAAILAEGFAHREAQPPLIPPAEQAKRRGGEPHRVGHNLLFRSRDRRADVPRFLCDPTVPFANNLAAQDGRTMKAKQKISGGFRSDEGAEDFGIIRTMLSTARKQGWNLPQAPIGDPRTLIAKLRFA